MKLITRTAALKEAPLILRNQPGYREVMSCLHYNMEELMKQALYSTSDVDIHRGRAQVLSAVIDYLEPK